MSSTRKKEAHQPKQHKPKKTKHYKRLAARDGATYQRALALLSDLRRGVGSYSKLLRKHRLQACTARQYLGRDLIGGTRGKRVRASKADRRVRKVLFPKSFGDVPIRTRNSRDASKLSDYYQDRDQLFRNKMSVHDFEAKWRGMRVDGQELFADATQILRMADAGELKVEDLYASTGGER